MVQTVNTNQEFTARLRRAASLRGWPSRGLGVILAKIAGTTPKAASKWLNAESIPRQAKIKSIASELNVRTAWLEYGELPMEIQQTEAGIPYSPQPSPLTDTNACNDSAPEFSYNRQLSHAAHRAIQAISQADKSGLMNDALAEHIEKTVKLFITNKPRAGK